MKTQIVNEISRDLLLLMPMFHEKLIKPSEGLMSDSLSRMQFFTINILMHDGLASMTELSSKMEMPKQQMTKIINRLCDAGFVERLYDKADRRIIRIKVTTSGETYLKDNRARLIELVSINVSKLEDSDIEEMRRATDSLTRILPKIGKITG